MTNLCFLMLRKLGCFWDGDKNIWKQVEFLPRWSHIYRKIGRPWGSGATAAKHADYHMWPMIILAITLGRFLIIEPVTFSCCPLVRTTNCKDKSYNYNHIRNLVENKKNGEEPIWNLCWMLYWKSVSVWGVEHWSPLPPWDWKITCHATGDLRRSRGV